MGASVHEFELLCIIKRYSLFPSTGLSWSGVAATRASLWHSQGETCKLLSMLHAHDQFNVFHVKLCHFPSVMIKLLLALMYFSSPIH